MKPKDQELANIAEAAKRVMNKETEVQPKDKDFVDLHSIDKEKRRGSTPLTEKDIEEANEFTKAAAKAAVAGDDEFEFDGKKYPTEMDIEVAKKILGESSEVKEAKMNAGVKTVRDNIFALEKPLRVGSAVNKSVNKALGGKFDQEFKDMAKALDTIISSWEEIEIAYGMSESTNLSESSEVKEGKFDKLKKKLKSINPETLGDVLNGKIKLSPDEKKEFDKFMADARKMFGVEFVKSFEAFDIEESTAEYAKSLEKIANDRKMKNLSKEDKATLMKIAAMMAKEDLEEDVERMPYDKVIKKLRDGEWDTSMDVKKRMHLTYTDNTERRKHLRGVQKVVFVEDVDTEEKPTTEK